MTVYEHPSFDHHELVTFASDPDSGLRAIIAVHSSAPLGMAGGGCRFKHYPREQDALRDVLRLSKAMSYKLALADIPAGGAKSVILAPEEGMDAKTAKLLRAFGRAVETLGGKYAVATDVGTTADDLAVMSETTSYVVADEIDTGWSTARGVFAGIDYGARHGLEKPLDRVHVAIQGLGKVGMSLAEQLAEAGARLTVADVNAEAVERATKQLGAEAADPDAIHVVDADVFAPCALGDVLDARRIDALRCRVVAGAANNPLTEVESDAERLMRRDVLYLPDFVLNMGGALAAGQSDAGHDPTERIHEVLDRVMATSKDHGSTHAAAVALAKEKLAARRAMMAR